MPEHSENYDIERGQREIDRQVKDVVDQREIGVAEIAKAEAEKVETATEKGTDSGDYQVKLKKGFVMETKGGVALRLAKDTAFEVVGQASETAVAGHLAAYPELYGAISSDLATTRDIDGVAHKVSYGAHGVEILEPAAQPKEDANKAATELGEKFLNVLKEAQSSVGQSQNTAVAVAPGNAGKGRAAKAHAADPVKTEKAVSEKADKK